MIVQSPQGASVDYTKNICAQVEKVLAGVHEVDSVFSITGFSFSGSAPNRGMVFASLQALLGTQRGRALFCRHC